MGNVKKFKDFLDKMQGLLDNAKKQGHIIVRIEDLENAFPELKESEDERIRKVLVGFFKCYKETDTCGSETFNGIPTDKILAWLEKQGEHANFRNKIHIGDKVTRNEDGALVNLSQLKRVAKPTDNQAKSALAMAMISQIMANDIENFGGAITDEEWENDKWKAIIYRSGNRITTSSVRNDYYFLAFHTEKQRALFLEKYPQLVHDFLMITDEKTK